MKNRSLIIATLLIAPSVAVSGSFGEKHDAVITLFQGNEEPTAKDAIWTSHDIFKVGVIDDGSDRSGYAEYVCVVLYEHGFKGKKVWVQVVDIAKLMRDGVWVKIGEARCQ